MRLNFERQFDSRQRLFLILAHVVVQLQRRPIQTLHEGRNVWHGGKIGGEKYVPWRAAEGYSALAWRVGVLSAASIDLYSRKSP